MARLVCVLCFALSLAGCDSPVDGGDEIATLNGGESAGGADVSGAGGLGGNGGQENVCVPDQPACDGNRATICNADGSGYLSEGTVCGTNEACDKGACKCACGTATPYCYAETCNVEPPSCADLPASCGASSNESCCMSPPVTGGSFERDNDPSYPATISSFRLDKYEVTVGRFRSFVDAVVTGWLPSPGSGKHTHVNQGHGLSNSAASTDELGWDATWNTSLPAFKSDWDSSSDLACDPNYATWTSSLGSNENRPINCVNWYQSAAFCIWDGGFLPSNAEGDYAAAGGSEQRLYPWGAEFPSGNTSLAVFGCYLNASGNCTGSTNIAPVGSVAAGNGRYGQADLAGNVAEWFLDWDGPYTDSPCDDCAELLPTSTRVQRGGSFFYYASLLPSTYHEGVPPEARSFDLGLRCARTP